MVKNLEQQLKFQLYGLASIAYGYFNLWFLIAPDIQQMNLCKDGYLIGFQLRQQFLLAVIPNCMAM